MKSDDISLDDLYNFMENGIPSDQTSAVNAYLEKLDKVRGMHLRIDKYGSAEAIIRHLMVVDKMKRLDAKRLYEEALEYFYHDTHISKKAFRNIYAEKMDKVINFAMLIMKDVSDAAKITKMLIDVYKARGLDVEDKEELPEELFRAPVKIYTADAAALGMPEVNRTLLKKQIESFPELTEKERSRIFQEAGIEPFKLFMDEQEDPRKS